MSEQTETVEQGLEVSAGVTDVAEVIRGMNDPSAALYSSIKSDSFEDRKAIAAALTTSTPVDENLNTVIQLKDFIIQPVDLADQNGNVNTAPRIVLIAADGSAFHATSVGLLSALKNIVAVVGEPATWDAPIAIRVVEQKGRNGYKFFTIEFV